MKELDSYQNKAPGDGGVKTGWEELESTNNISQTSWEDLATLGNRQSSSASESVISQTAAVPETATYQAPESSVSLPDLPRTSKDWTCKFYLKEIERENRMGDVKAFLESALNREYQDLSSDPADLDQFCEDYSDRLSSALSPDEKLALKEYSGFNYKYINQVARGQWNYDILGRQTPENLARAKQSISNLNEAIAAAPPLDTDVAAYRGTNLDTFIGYDIHSISDLTSLKDQFFHEAGFTSTSLSHEQSFAGREDFDDPLRRACNVTINYLIPSESNEVAGLFSSETSYGPNQRELLIDSGSLSYVSDVQVSPDKSSAKLQMVLIPREIYDPNAAKA